MTLSARLPTGHVRVECSLRVSRFSRPANSYFCPDTVFAFSQNYTFRVFLSVLLNVIPFPGPNSKFTYQVFFMRKLWSSTVPGKDRQADIIFHFHQELPKLLRGYHQCTNEEAAILAALIYRVKHAESKVDIAGVLKSLLPSDLLKKMSSYEWKKEIVRAYNKDSGMSPDEAKVAFLKVIYRWPTYGSAFFEVTQVSDPNLPANLLVAINKQGLNLIQPEGKVRNLEGNDGWMKVWIEKRESSEGGLGLLT